MKMIVDTGIANLNKYGEELCGDKVELVQKSDRVTAVLSDGLGSGVKANILATLTAKIIITMLTEGATLEDVITTISRTLPVCRERKIAYSTFSIIQVDLEKEEASIIEFDNPHLFLIREGRLQEIRMHKRMLAEKEIKESSFRVVPGDWLVLVSDGVIHAGIGGLLSLGWQWEEVGSYLEKVSSGGIKAGELASWMIQVCNRFYDGKPGDDTTVVALNLRYPRRTTVLVGPPADPASDPEVVKLLMQNPGRKVVCGGTTSKLVARELKQSLEVDLKTARDDPPQGKIPGVDLVTEGVITLSRALEILREGKENLISKKGNRSGSEELVKILINSDYINFIVGRAINPAYQNPDLPLDFNFKLQLVNSMEKILREKGKEVHVRYF